MVWSDQSQFPFNVYDNNGNLIFVINETGAHVIGQSSGIDLKVGSGVNPPAEIDFTDVSGNGATPSRIFAQRDAGANAMLLRLISGQGSVGSNGGQSSIDLRSDAMVISYTRTSPPAPQPLSRKIVLDNTDYFPITALPAGFQNGWSNFGGTYAPGGFVLTPTQDVRLRGVVQGGTTADGTVIATLPIGYRPSTDKILPVVMCTLAGITAAAQINIRTNGQVQCYNMGASSGLQSWEGITYDLY